MKFTEALRQMKKGIPMKLPSWGGYWKWDDKAQTIIIHTKDNQELDIRETQRVEYTLQNVLSEDWIPADEKNCPVFGGTAEFDFPDAVRYLKKGLKVARRGWNGKGMFLFLAYGKDLQNCTGIEDKCVDVLCMKTAQNTVVFGWLASQTDIMAEDWVFVEEETI